MKKGAIICTLFIFLASLVFADVPDIGDSSCVTYAQARAQGISGTDSELRAKGFCAETGTTTPGTTTPTAQTQGTAYAPGDERTSDYSTSGLTNEQLSEISDKAFNEMLSIYTEVQSKSVAAEDEETLSAADAIWTKHMDAVSNNLNNVYLPKSASIEADRSKCVKVCNAKYTEVDLELVDGDRWNICFDACNKIAEENDNKEYKTHIDFTLQNYQQAISELNALDPTAGEKPVEGPGIPEEAKNELEQAKEAMQKAEQDRTQANVEAAIAEAEKNNVAVLVTQGSIKKEDGSLMELIPIGTTINTKSPVHTKLAEGSELLIAGNSEVVMDNPFEEGIKLIKGKLKIIMRKLQARHFIINTRFGAMSVRGTEFIVETNESATNVYLYNGSLDITTSAGKQMSLESGNVLTMNNDGTASIVPLQEDIWNSLGNEFGSDSNKAFTWYFYVTLTVIMLETIAVILYTRTPKQKKIDLSILSVICSIIGIFGALLPIVGYTFSITAVTLAKLQKKQATKISKTGYILGVIGVIANCFAVFAMAVYAF